MSAIGIHQFSGKVLDQSVSFQVLKLNGQILLWIGLAHRPVFKELALAMSTAYEKSPTPVKLLGEASSITSAALAGRLSKRCNKPVFVSFNVPESSQEMLSRVEERLLEEMSLAPEHF